LSGRDLANPDIDVAPAVGPAIRNENGNPPAVKDCEIIADNLSKAGWSYGYVSALDREGRTIWIADAHRDDGKRFIVRADEKMAAFLELERVTRETLGHRGNRMIGLLERKLNPLRKKPAT
jgi:hypothetical protein